MSALKEQEQKLKKKKEKREREKKKWASFIKQGDWICH